EVRNAPDRIETGTFMIAAAMHANSRLTLTGCNPKELGVFPDYIKQAGIDITVDGTDIHVKAPEKITPVSIKTAVFPGFPTDLQAQWCTMMTQATGSSTVTDAVYADRFSYIPELNRLGAHLQLSANKAQIQGNTTLDRKSVV